MSEALIPSAARLREIAGGFARARVALVGDVAADVFLEGETHRISREAPVLVVRQTETHVVPGQAGNVARNLVELARGDAGGGGVRCVAAVGDDREGRDLVARLSAEGVDVGAIATVGEGFATNTKTRILAGGSHTRRQQIVRVDRDMPLPADAALAGRLAAAAGEAAREAHAVIVSDYGYGVVTTAAWDAVRTATAAAGVPLLLDSRYRLGELRGADVITPNYEEALELVGHRHRFARLGKADLAAAAAERAGARAVVLKCGNDGMAVLARFGGAATPATIFGVNGAEEPVDVSGAGDTVVATLALALASGASLVEAAHLANIAAGIAVSKVGTATVSPTELAAALAEWPSALRGAREE